MKKCIRCDRSFVGRSDKKFCCTDCKNSWNNETHKQRYRAVFRTNRILKRNYRILNRIYGEGRDTPVGKSDLVSLGFDFRYITSIHRKGLNPRYWRGCYDLHYRMTRRGIEIVRADGRSQESIC